MCQAVGFATAVSESPPTLIVRRLSYQPYPPAKGGAPQRRDQLSDRARVSRLSSQIGGLDSLTVAQLRAEWRRWHKGHVMPAGLGRDLATRAIAWRMQEKVHGGLTPALARQLQRFMKVLDEGGDLDLGSVPQLKPGTKLVREWRGHVHHVLVLESGFEYRDRHYRSLTPVAREITGAHWSGPRFFGLKENAGGR